MKRTVAVLVAPKTFEFVEEEIPVLKPDEFLIKTISVGLCHSDVPAYLGTSSYGLGPKGRYVMADEVPYPQVKGHEPVGQVVEVGSAVTKFKPGDYVTGHIQGTFATYFVASESGRFAVIPKSDKPVECCLGEPATCCSYIAQKAAPVFGDSVAIVGAGFMGLLSMCGLNAPFLKDVVAIDFDQERLDYALQFGATKVINPSKVNLEDAVAEITNNKGFDVVIELTGSIKGLGTAAKICRTLQFGDTNSGSRIVSSSVYAKPEPWDPVLGHELMFHAPEIQVAHPWGITDYNDLLEKAVNAYVSGVYPMDKMVTHSVPFEKLADGFGMLTSKVPGFIKGIVKFD